MDMSMQGRVALVTGGSMGLGFAMGKRFAKAGAKVALVARNRERLDAAQAAIAEVSDSPTHGIARDIADSEACKHVADEAISHFGQVDVLVNNAGASRRGPFEEITDAAWQEDLDLKLFAWIRLTRLLAPSMKERRWGRIVNVANIGAKAPGAGGAPTAVSRAAGIALTKALSQEYAPYNVLVNALCVGLIKSDQWVRRHAEAAAGGNNQTLDDFYADMGKPIPMGRLGEAEEFADMACFLASDAGGYVTGTAINVDGGRSPVV